MPSIIPLGATTSAPASPCDDRDPAENLEGLVVQDVAVGVEEAAVAVVRVLAEADVGHDDELRARFLERADRLLDRPVVGEALDTVRILRARDAEEENRLDAERLELTGFASELVDGELVDTGHRGHGAADAVAGNDEERVDEVVRLERRLANEVAQGRRSAQATRALGSGCRPECLQRVELRHVLSPKCDTSVSNDAVRRRLVGDQPDLEPHLSRDLRRLRADAHEHRPAARSTGSSEAPTRRAAREDDRVRNPEREDPPHRRLDVDGAIGDDDVDLGALPSKLLRETGVGDVGLGKEHSDAFERPEARRNVVRCARGDDTRARRHGFESRRP